MAARFWREVLGGALLLAATVTGILALSLPLALSPALCIALAILLALPLLFVAASFLAARVGDTRDGGALSAGCALRAVLGETLEFSRAVLRMSTDPPQRRDTAAPPAEHPARPVMLIHGVVCNRGVWRALEQRLQAEALVPIGAVNVEPLLDDIECQARRVEPAVLELQRQCHGARVALIGHSMGGLVARALLRRVGAGVISRIVTIGSPHHGTTFARRLPWPATRQMSPDSSWLQALNAAQEGQFGVPVTCVYSLEDNLIAPARSAQLGGAVRHELRCLGHFGLLNSRRSLDAIVAALRPACPE